MDRNSEMIHSETTDGIRVSIILMIFQKRFVKSTMRISLNILTMMSFHTIRPILFYEARAITLQLRYLKCWGIRHI